MDAFVRDIGSILQAASLVALSEINLALLPTDLAPSFDVSARCKHFPQPSHKKEGKRKSVIRFGLQLIRCKHLS